MGYVTRSNREEEFTTKSYAFDTVSESEFHTLFAEAVVAGQPPPSNSSTQDAEIITGVPMLDPAHQDDILFFNDPRVGYYILGDQNARAGDTAVSGASIDCS